MKGEEMTGRVGRMDGMGDLAEFLLARIAEDEEAAGDANVDNTRWWVDGPGERSGLWWIYGTGQPFADRATAEHIARHDPARVLAECDAKRRILAHEIDSTGLGDGYYARLLALPYADHPDFRSEWRP